MPEKPPPFPFPILCSLVHYYSQSSPLRCEFLFRNQPVFFTFAILPAPKPPLIGKTRHLSSRLTKRFKLRKR